MEKHSKELELIANTILNSEEKPNYTDDEFMNCVLIFQNALMDKMYDNQNYDNMNLEDRSKMASKAGNELRKFIFTYTNLDTRLIWD